AHIEEIVDQAAKLPDLPLHHRVRTRGRLRIAAQLEDRESVEERRERITQLMRQHGEELALLGIRRLQVGRPLAKLPVAREYAGRGCIQRVLELRELLQACSRGGDGTAMPHRARR